MNSRGVRFCTWTDSGDAESAPTTPASWLTSPWVIPGIGRSRRATLDGHWSWSVLSSDDRCWTLRGMLVC